MGRPPPVTTNRTASRRASIVVLLTRAARTRASPGAVMPPGADVMSETGIPSLSVDAPKIDACPARPQA